MIPQEWNIQPRALVCAASGRPFREGETVYSALYWREGHYERIDLRAEAWEARQDNIAPLSAWQTEFVPPAAAPVEALNKTDAESMLRRLMKENDAAMSGARYILALMLERKKILRQVERQRPAPGVSVLVYEHIPTGEIWLIDDPGVKLGELKSLQDEVAALLAGSIEATGAAAEK
jgi:hypothetical protein